jgi:hypothetical protein
MTHVKDEKIDNKGFTIIELMLSMTFISVLLIAIVLTTIQISNIYTRGLTLKEVNQVGRSVSEDLQSVIASSVPFNVDTSSPTSRYIVHDGGGRLCTGNYSYAWNYGKAFAGEVAIYNKYDDGSDVRFARINDSSSSLCINASADIPKTNATEMLAAGDHELAMHDFTIISQAEDVVAGETLYALSFIIGTNNQDQLLSDDTSCKPPSEGVGDENYCAVNQFEIVVRAGNRSGGE